MIGAMEQAAIARMVRLIFMVRIIPQKDGLKILLEV
jgi:hypothetical protein